MTLQVGYAKIVNFYLVKTLKPHEHHQDSLVSFNILHSSIRLFSTIASSVVLQPLDLAFADLITQLLNQIMETNDSPDGDALSKIPLRNTNSALRLCIAHPLLAIEQDDNTSDNTAFLLNDAYSLTQGRSRRDHVVDDDNPLALQWGTDDISTLAMILGLLAVERIADVVPGVGSGDGVAHGQFVGHGRGDGNALVSRTINRPISTASIKRILDLQGKNVPENDIKVWAGCAIRGNLYKRLGGQNAGISGRCGPE